MAPFLPEFVGQKGPEIVLGKNSGLQSIEIGLEKLGVEATDEEKAELLTAVKNASFAKNRALTEGEFEELVKTVLSK